MLKVDLWLVSDHSLTVCRIIYAGKTTFLSVLVVKLENLTNNLPIQDQVITSGVILSGSDTVDFSWKFTWPATDNSIDKMGKMDIIRITVTVEQVD